MKVDDVLTDWTLKCGVVAVDKFIKIHLHPVEKMKEKKHYKHCVCSVSRHGPE